MSELKTASELALEYWAKTPMERMHSTLQGYVYDYMAQQNERNKTTCIAQEAEIARLQSGFDELRNRVNLLIDQRQDMFDEYSNGKVFALQQVLTVLDRITGAD